ELGRGRVHVLGLADGVAVAGVVPGDDGVVVRGGHAGGLAHVEPVAPRADLAVDRLVGDPDVLGPGDAVVGGVRVIDVVDVQAGVVTEVPPDGVDAAVGRHAQVGQQLGVELGRVVVVQP